MSVRYFNGDNDLIQIALGSLGYSFGPGSAAAIIRPESTGWTHRILKAGLSISSARWELRIESSGRVAFQFGPTTRSAPTADFNAPWGEWSLIACRKEVGTVSPRWSLFKFNPLTWVHGNGLEIENGGVPEGSGAIGSSGSFSEFMGACGIIGAWNRVISDTELHTLVQSIQAWIDTAPVALWPLNQAVVTDPIQDIIGGADQTSRSGTTVLNEEIPWVTLPPPMGVRNVKVGGQFMDDKPVMLKHGGTFVNKDILTKKVGIFE